jgi:DNA invertase Pin-like site-specific DNA recombinase
MRAIGYVRVSTEDQAQGGVSLEAQEKKIRAYGLAKGWDLTKVVKDGGYSDKDLNRPGMQEILKGCKKREFDVVVILKLDRLTGSVKDLGYLVEDVFKRGNIAFSSIQDNFDTSTANGRMVMNILATIARWERDIISERTKDAMQFMKNSLKLIEMEHCIASGELYFLSIWMRYQIGVFPQNFQDLKIIGFKPIIRKMLHFC